MIDPDRFERLARNIVKSALIETDEDLLVVRRSRLMELTDRFVLDLEDLATVMRIASGESGPTYHWTPAVWTSGAPS